MNQWATLALLSIVLASTACDKVDFFGRSRSKKKQNEQPAPQALPASSFIIRTVEKLAATDNNQGAGEVLVTTDADVEVTCLNCNQALPLTFTKMAASDPNRAEWVAPFDYPLVTGTKLCKLQLRLASAPRNAVSDVKYGVYLCPIDQASGVKSCTKEQVETICTI